MENKFSLDDLKEAYFHAAEAEMEDFNDYGEWSDEEREMHLLQCLHTLDIVLRMKVFLKKKGEENGRSICA